MNQKLSLLNPQLEAFMAVVTHKSMHRAAKAIHLSQTAITQRIQALERRLQTTLFIRTHQGVSLTVEGEALLRYCHAVLDLSGETFASISGAGITTTLRISITGPTSIMISRIIPQCLEVMKKFPQLLMSFDINDTDQRLHSLHTGVSQFAILEPEKISKEMKIKGLNTEKYFLVCSKSWKKRKLQDIIQSERIIDFDENDSMSFEYLKCFNLFKYAQKERLFVNRTESLAKMIMDGYGYGVLTEEFSKPYVENNQLIILNAGKVYENSLVLAWYDRPEPPKYFLSLIKAIG
jgi:LysR family transcriptional regulator (chromosome initiation inhibitor)